ncbi:AraC family transcriptional regulator [Phenylobacterium deserti]|uniref:AraC family transcriptional regulator CmrA n=1 Tax=Phenylobacterium deserti TaxID=1914756 RepID=A0A328ASZ6_9CAUL|nr:AraC family transcriptional regulator [Phenylobacterium deserti]RAK56806.1 AraC family transcriptional regulator CmrA [Phenylobacterium deserti]
MDQMHELLSLVRRYGENGATETAVPGLGLYLAAEAGEPSSIVYRPLMCLIVAGAKRTVLGERVYRYAAGDYIAASVDLPVTGQVTDAPYAAISFDLDPARIADLLLDLPPAPDSGPVGLEVHRAEPDLVDALVRLTRLLERPADIPVLAPMISREVLWRLLQGPSGPMVRQIALSESRLSQVNRAIRWLRANYAEAMRVEALANLAGMSLASFHRHFKAVTAMSPLQYQKQLRLQEARSRLMSQPGDVAGVGFAVGYDSPSQFSREYARLFGAPPGRDAVRLRASPQPQAVP